MKQIVTSRVKTDIVLRDVEERDLAVFFEQQLGREATEMAAFPSRTRDSFMAHWHKSMAERTSLLKTIVVGGRVAGNVVYWEQDDEPKVGYWLGREYWGKGHSHLGIVTVLETCKKTPAVCPCRQAECSIDTGIGEVWVYSFRRRHIF